MIIFGGGSIIPNTGKNILNYLSRIFKNFIYISSFDIGQENMKKYIRIINKEKPKFGYGYPSSWHFLSKYIEKNNLMTPPFKAIFTSSEKLYPHMREKIEEVFKCEVYDTYGLNDGGLSAFECSEHSGLHINPIRSLLEIVDEKGKQIKKGEGKILATSLYNYAMPFIRYDTGNIASVLPPENNCNCNINFRRLKEIVGRIVDFFETPEGKKVHGWFFLYFFWKYCKGIRKYQVIQHDLNKIIIKIVKNKGFSKRQIGKIREIIRKKSNKWEVKIDYVDNIKMSKSGKFKFIINEMRKKMNISICNIGDITLIQYNSISLILIILQEASFSFF